MAWLRKQHFLNLQEYCASNIQARMANRISRFRERALGQKKPAGTPAGFFLAI
jgi:hypothetical protein